MCAAFDHRDSLTVRAADLDERAVAELPRRVVIHGPPGAGKSHALRKLHAASANTTILLDPPAAAPDAPEACLAILTDELARLGVDAHRTDIVRDPDASFRQKVESLLAAIHDEAPAFTLLCDAPGLWSASAAEHTDLRAAFLLASLNELAWHGWVVAAPTGSEQEADQHWELRQERHSPQLLLEVHDWGPAREAAERASAWLRQGTELSVDVFRLLVLTIFLRVPKKHWTIHPLDLASLIATRMKRWPALAEAWAAVAVLRDGLDDATFVERLVADEDAREIVRMLGIESDPLGKVRMTPLARRVAMHPLVGLDKRRAAHARAWTYYDSRSRAPATPSTRSHLEAIMHLGLSGNVEALADQELIFREQLHHIGWWLSWQERDHAAAAEVFRLAVKRNHNDGYAQHYLAFNLDVLGKEPETVEDAYRKALDQDWSQLWWHSRWIRFLIARERIDDAREAWEAARLELLPPDGGVAPHFVYEELHRDVTRWLLETLEFDFARAVLNDVPNVVRDQDPTFGLLEERVAALAAADPATDVVPLHLASRNWAEDGPFLLRRDLGGLATLQEWWAGLIEAVSDGIVRLTVMAVRPDDTSAPEWREATVPAEQLIRDSEQPADVEVGRHVEVGFYRTSEGGLLTLAQIHPSGPEWYQGLPRPFPRPLRYVENAPIYVSVEGSPGT